jgi:hypothetical protein
LTSTIEPETALRVPPQARRGRAAQNQHSLLREVNERIAALQPSEMFIQFACECGRAGCTSTVPLSVDQYERVRQHPRRFIVAPGHERPARERVVETSAHVVVIEQADPPSV